MTTDKAGLIALAALCEAATGPDRVIDGLIFSEITRGEPYIIGNQTGHFPQMPIYGERADVMREMPTADGAEYICAPRFTASIDAAMSFVPVGWHPSVILRQAIDNCIIADSHDKIGFSHALPAFICAASLRAIASKEPTT